MARPIPSTADPFQPKPQPSPVQPWQGWYRAGRRGRWHIVCAAQQKKECWHLLLDYHDGGKRVEAERCVLPSGERPS
jgi:hypothetical protein